MLLLLLLALLLVNPYVGKKLLVGVPNKDNMADLAAGDTAAAPDGTDAVYQCLVVDSGPIIRLTGASSLWKKAHTFYTVPAVLQEIRDAKARQHLEQLPFDLQTREASREGIHAVSEFARQTGDYASLSAVDLQVLGLLYDLEREACCGDVSHIRTTPKRTLGLGKIELLGGEKQKDIVEGKDCLVVGDEEEAGNQADATVVENKDDDVRKSAGILTATNEVPENNDDTVKTVPNTNYVQTKPRSWAALLNNNTSAAAAASVNNTAEFPQIAVATEQKTRVTFAQLTVSDEDAGGQFSDAESEEDPGFESKVGDASSSSCSDEECEAYVLDPDEVRDRERASRGAHAEAELEKELQSEFPCLAASLTVPYKGSDGEDEKVQVPGEEERTEDDAAREAEEEERKRRSLRPISKSGKLYNSFTKYGDLMKSKPKKEVVKKQSVALEPKPPTDDSKRTADDSVFDKNQSRIMGGRSFAGQGEDVEDDGEGWITCTKDIRTIKAAGALDPSRSPSNLDLNAASKKQRGPPSSQRAACTTTDFAMQNVILQMNLELLSVDGMKVRKLKNWVTRCGACYTVYTSSDNVGPLGKRLFCERCGSDLMQRIAASVDGKTGRLRLHLSKKYKHNLRGTKFSLPKPGSGNRFQGDLLLREDQLMMGAWNQKVKMRSGGKAKSSAQSMFGRDIASNVGCHASAMTSDDIRVGFGRRNPNAAKGRERRGKKKKSSDKACGLRRY